MQGRAEFVEKYFETVADLLARGFAVAAFDWRGQGASARSLSDASKGHVADFSLFRHDLEAIGTQLLDPYLPKPFVALAHSMGGCIALTAASEGWLPVDRLIALAPMVELKMVKHPRTVRLLVRLLSSLGFGERFVPGGDGRSISTLGFAGNRLSSDLPRYQRNAVLAEALGTGAIGAPTIGWLAAAYRAMDRFRDPALAARINLPVLVVAAGDDPVCSTSGIVAFAERLKSGPAVVIPDSRHEILMETDAIRAAFWDQFDSFTLPAAGGLPGSAAQDVEHGAVQARVAAGDD
jgi:lysophospholipase